MNAPSTPADWWYIVDGKRQGPLNAYELQRLVIDRTLAPTSLVWKQGMYGWQPAGEVDELRTFFVRLPAEVTETISPDVPPLAKAARTPLRKATTAIAFTLLIAIWLSLGTFVYANAKTGIPHVFLQAVPFLLAVGAVAWMQRKSIRPFAWDVGLAATAAWLIFMNRQDIQAALEHGLQSEIRPSSHQLSQTEGGPVNGGTDMRLTS